MKIPLLGALSGFLAGMLYWGVASLISRSFDFSPSGEINLGRIAGFLLLPLLLLLLFPAAVVVPNRLAVWYPGLAALTGFFTSAGLFVSVSIYRTVWGMKYEYLQVNDWSSYVQFEIFANGIPLFLIGTLAGFGAAKLRNSKIASDNHLKPQAN